ncbi:Peptidyl-prolyl cis-trans isomerase FKBP16-1 chloroplastic [Zea mays]|uniref:Peptidyl-prolyl cis-trans isomerase FKBP16-1 chloroplastic n=1 Tax=Zea mays TaxID=4577 RepID=A0A1D6HBP6_MAIZE|nr:Peptidyl-prolyl cis-trans isomerase FKBP16-1 chloroplastic [Zea mays]
MAVVGAVALSTPTPTRAKKPDVTRYRKLGSGVILEDVVKGEGAEAREGDLVQFNYVCRRANGYFVHRCVVEFLDAIALLFGACTEDACYTTPDFESDRVQSKSLSLKTKLMA